MTPEEREDEPPPAKTYSGGDFLLSSLPPDLLKELYKYIALPFVARLVCRAMRDAHPERTEIRLSKIVKSQWTFMWAYRVGCPFEWSVELSAKMARHGAMASLRWAHMNGMPRDRETCYRAARCGHLETLKLACATGCPIMTEYVAKGAAIGGHVRVLEWLHAHYAIPWDEWTTIGAARHGKLEALQWLRARQCPWNSWCIVNAAIGGHLHVIEWARANGCRLSREAMVWAARNGHTEVCRCLIKYGAKIDAVCTVDGDDWSPISLAKASGHADTVALLERRLTPCAHCGNTAQQSGVHEKMKVCSLCRSVHYCSKQCSHAAWVAAGGGHIVNTCSIASVQGRPNRIGYCAAKGGFLTFTKALAADLSDKNIRVNALAPGMIETPMNQALADDPKVGSAWNNENLVGRWGQPEDVAKAAVFLASPDADFMTGATIQLDGGAISAYVREGEMQGR